MRVAKLTRKYDIEKFPFRKIIEEMFETKDLEHLHKLHGTSFEFSDQASHRNTPYHDKFYNHIDNKTDLGIKFMTLIDEFMRHIAQLDYGVKSGDKMVLQSFPSFRLSLPGGKSSNLVHKDSDHGVIAETYHYVIAFTDTFDSNALQMESETGKGDFTPINCNEGEFVRFDATNLMHKATENKTGVCSVRLDIRMMHPNDYHEVEFATPVGNHKMKIGDYWRILKI